MTRANKQTYPFVKEGLEVTSKLDELMIRYYRVDDGSEEGFLHREAFEVGQQLQFYFAVYSVAVINETLQDRKMRMPSVDHAIKGLEAPMTLMLDNEFFRNNYQVLLSGVLCEITRMATARALDDKDATISYALSICKWEYLSTIAGLVGGTKAQRAMDLEMRRFTSTEMEAAMTVLRDAKPQPQK